MAIDLNGSTGISLDDNEKINIGNDSDLQIFHDGSASRIHDNGTGNLILSATDFQMNNGANNETMLTAASGGAVTLNYSGNSKLATTSTGIQVTGDIANASGDLTLDVAGGVILDAGDGTIALHEAGNGVFGTFTRASGSLAIKSEVSDADIIFKGNDGGSVITAMTIDMSAGGNVGIGTSNPIALLSVVDSSTGSGMELQPEAASNTNRLTNYNRTASAYKNFRLDALQLEFQTSGNERMRINGSGEILIGKTSAASSTVGAQIIAGGISQFGRSGAEALRLTRTTNDGDILQFQKNDTLIGTIGVVNTDHLVIAATYSTGTGIKFSNNLFKPVFDSGADKDNAVNLGSSSARFNDIYATNGTIQTSDFNEKQDIASLTATEMLVGKRISALFKTFRWKDKVAEKGDNARTHTGVIAQDVQAAFTAEGLDAGDYALFISSTWWETQTEVPAVEAVAEVTDEDGNVTTEAVEAVDAYTRTDTYDTEDEAPEGATSKTRLGIRYPELLSFVAAYNEQRFASIEARLTALEA
jgi:hypothetical protein